MAVPEVSSFSLSNSSIKLNAPVVWERPWNQSWEVSEKAERCLAAAWASIPPADQAKIASVAERAPDGMEVILRWRWPDQVSEKEVQLACAGPYLPGHRLSVAICLWIPAVELLPDWALTHLLAHELAHIIQMVDADHWATAPGEVLENDVKRRLRAWGYDGRKYAGWKRRHAAALSAEVA